MSRRESRSRQEKHSKPKLPGLQDTRYREEQQKRQEAESREKQFVVEMEERMEQDRKYREEQEQQLLALEEERRNYERLLREEQNATDAEKRRCDLVLGSCAVLTCSRITSQALTRGRSCKLLIS